MILRLVWRNLWRNRRRTLITMASVSFAVLLAIVSKSLQSGTWNYFVSSIVGYYTGYVQLHKQGYWDEQVLDNSFVLGDSLREALSKDVASTYTPRIESYMLAAGDELTRGCLAVGVDPERETKLTRLREKLVSGSYFNDDGLIVSEGLAERLHLAAGDTIVLLGQGYRQTNAAGKYPVAGIARFGSPQLNEGIVFMQLNQAQELFDAAGRVTSVVFMLEDRHGLDAFTDSLAGYRTKGYEVLTWKEMMPQLVDQMTLDVGGFYIQIGILYLVVAFGIFGTVIMMTMERRFEFGMLTAVGMRKSLIARMLMGETLLIAILGTICGMLLSYPVVYYMTTHPIRFTGEMARAYESFGFEPVLPSELVWSNFLGQGAVVLVIALVIGLYPLVSLTRLNTTEALKR